MLPRVRDVRRMGSAALDLCFVACGRLDAYVERGPQAVGPRRRPAGRARRRAVGSRGSHGEPAGELLTTAAPASIYDAFQACLLTSGFGDWPMPEWPVT